MHGVPAEELVAPKAASFAIDRMAGQKTKMIDF